MIYRIVIVAGCFAGSQAVLLQFNMQFFCLLKSTSPLSHPQLAFSRSLMYSCWITSSAIIWLITHSPATYFASSKIPVDTRRRMLSKAFTLSLYFCLVCPIVTVLRNSGLLIVHTSLSNSFNECLAAVVNHFP